MRIIASDSLEGRDTGSEGQKKAAAYLREQFIAFGIPEVPSASYPRGIEEGYYQTYEIIEERSGSITVTAGRHELLFMRDFLYFDHRLTSDLVVDRLFYAGNGSALPEIRGLEGSAVLITDEGAMGPADLLAGLRKNASEWSRSGASLILVSTPRFNSLLTELGPIARTSRMRLADPTDPETTPVKQGGTQTIIVDEGSLDGILGRKRARKLTDAHVGLRIPVDLTVRAGEHTRTITSENVLAYIEGSDRRDEVVVITAHYDHIGVENGEVFNGADDDGSGTVALLEIAEAFTRAKENGHGPRRSVLIMPVSGEEKGLLGSRYYSESPVFPLENTIANLNIDMIGRVDSTHIGSVPYIYVIGSDRLSSELHAINEEANRRWTGLELDYTFNAADDPNRFYYRSDHYNFARKGVPSIFYFSGVHDDYHGPGDEVDKIMFDLLRQRTLLVFHTAWALANRDARITVDKP